jgi:hypothetical protein
MEQKIWSSVYVLTEPLIDQVVQNQINKKHGSVNEMVIPPYSISNFKECKWNFGLIGFKSTSFHFIPFPFSISIFHFHFHFYCNRIGGGMNRN